MTETPDQLLPMSLDSFVTYVLGRSVPSLESRALSHVSICSVVSLDLKTDRLADVDFRPATFRPTCDW